MDEEQDELSSLDQYFQDLTAVEGESPLSALARDPREKLLIQQAEAAEQRRKKAFEEQLAAIEAAKQRLLKQPTPQSKAQMLAGMVQKFREGRSDPNDPRFYEKRNLMSVLRDVGAYRRGRLEEEKKAAQAREEQQLKLDDLRRRYMFEEAGREAEAARGALEKYKPPSAGQTTEFERLIAGLPKEEQEILKKNRATILSSRAPTTGRRLSQFDRAVEATVRKRQGIATPEDEAVLQLTQKGGLTLPQQTRDAEILKARDFIKGFTPQQIDMAFRKGQYRNAQENDIVYFHNLARKKTYQEMLASGEVSPSIPEEAEEEAIEEDMTDMPE